MRKNFPTLNIHKFKFKGRARSELARKRNTTALLKTGIGKNCLEVRNVVMLKFTVPV